MADTLIQDRPADSSSAIEVPRGGAEYAKWRMTGELPAAKPADPSQEGAQPSKESSAPDKGGNSAPASEAGKGTQENRNKPQRDNAATRLNEILGDLKEAGLTPAELKQFKQNWQRSNQAEPGKQTPAPEKTANPASQVERPKRPKLTEWAGTMEEYEAGVDKYETDLAQYNEQVWEQKQIAKAAQQTVHQKIKEAEGRYGAESGALIASTARTLGGDQEISGTVKELLGGSPCMVDVLYTLGSKPEELASFVHLAKSDPAAAVRKLVVLEQLVEQELSKGAKGKDSLAADEGSENDQGDDANDDASVVRDRSGKFQKKTPERKESDAPPPPREVSGRGTPPPDPVERAFKDSDTRAYMRLKNEEAARNRRR